MAAVSARFLVVDREGLVHPHFHVFAPTAGKRAVEALATAIREWQPTHVLIAQDNPWPTFRHGICDAQGLSTYKGHREQRSGAERAALFDQLAQFSAIADDALGATGATARGFEGDDVIATAVHAAPAGTEVRILARDKDLLQLLTPLVSMWDGKEVLTTVADIRTRLPVDTPEQVVDYLAAVGDPADGVAGLRNIGDVAAQAVLARFGAFATGIISACAWKPTEGTGPDGDFWSAHRRVWSALASPAVLARFETMCRLTRLRTDACEINFDTLRA